MKFDLISLTAAANRQAVASALACNAETEKYGLTLTQAEATALVESRAEALHESRLVEFGSGVTEKLIRAFCDSPYISKGNYAETLCELTGLFYDCREETLGLMSDDRLIAFMKSAFNGVCRGSTELLAGRELFRLSRNLRAGLPADTPEEDEDDREE